MTDKVEKPDTAWRADLTPEQYAVCRCGGTEAPFTGQYWNSKTPGTYHCAACDAPLFDSDAKYDSGSGWPSFRAALDPAAVTERRDTSHGMVRVEILCARCDSHLGHLFPDGPKPTGLRYCTNSASLRLEPREG